MNKQLKMVREFHDAFNYEQADHNCDELVPLSRKVTHARMAFITEELSEILLSMASGNREKMLDGAVDLSYFALGTLAIVGRDLEVPSEGVGHRPETNTTGEILVSTEDASLANLLQAVNLVLSKLMFYRNGEAADELSSSLSLLHCMCIDFTLKVVKASFYEAFAEVQRSNMSKLDTDGRPLYNEAGKILKGPNFSQPKLAPFLLKDA